jgi:arsenate reductase (thioredoxin)
MTDMAEPFKKQNILFLCTGNSCRSQMAEAWTRYLHGECIEAYSAGIEARGLDPFAVKVMAEAGMDISRQLSKKLESLQDLKFDLVVTVCGNARDNCPIFPGKAKTVHVGFDDPPALAAGAKTEEESLVFYRRVRDEIREFVKKLPSLIKTWSVQ